MRAWHLLEEEWQALSCISSSTSLGSSPEPPLEFQEIARSLTTGKSPKMEIEHPQTGVAQELLVELAVATVISTTMCQDQTMGTIYLPTVTTSMVLMNLEAPSVAVGCQGLTIEELTEEDLAESHPL